MSFRFVIVLSLFCSSLSNAQFFEQCLPISGYSEFNVSPANSVSNNTSIKKNSSGEIVLIGDAKIFRLSKDGVKLWEKNVQSRFRDFAIDKDGGVYAIHNLSQNLVKYNSNGSLAWEKYSGGGSFAKVVVDNSNNVFALNNNNGLILSRFSSTGAETLNKSYSNLIGKSVAVNASGEIYLLGSDFINGGYNLMKISSTGIQLWSNPINYNFFNGELIIGQDGNIYAFLSDDYSTRALKVNPLNGNIIGDILLDSGKPVVREGSGYVFFVLGIVSTGNYGIHKISNSFNSTLITFSDFYLYNPIDRNDYKSLDIENDGSIVFNVIVRNNKDEKSGVYAKTNSSGNIILSKQFIPITGGIIIDYQGNYIIPTDNECLKKLTLCDKLTFSISNQPMSNAICSGTDAQFSMMAIGQDLLYQWRKGTDLLPAGTKYLGVSTNTLTIKAASIEDLGQYYCDVFDACNRKLTTNAINISFVSSTGITTQPQSLTQCNATDAIFQITTTGGQNVKYQWRKGAATLSENTTAIGTKTNKLTLKNILSTDAGEYYCDVTSDCFTVPLVSQKGLLTVLQPVTILTQPQAVSGCTGATSVFSISGAGSNLTYQWRKGTTNLTESSLVVGTKTSLLTIKDIKSADAGDYNCVVTGTCGTAITTSSAALSVSLTSQITSQPISKSVCAGTQTTFSIAAIGTSLVYSWKKDNVALTNGAKYAGVNTATLTISSISTTETGSYTCTITNVCGNDIFSNAAFLSIATAPAITAKSSDVTQCAGQIVNMSISATGNGITYQWKKNGTSLLEGNGISGSKSSSLIVSKATLSDAGNYTCEVASGCGANQTSGIIKLVVQEEITITTQPISKQSCINDKVTLAVGVSGSAQSYQWKKNGTNISNNSQYSGVTTAILTFQKAGDLDQGLYSCEIKTLCGNMIVSNGAQLNVNPRPDLELLPINCEFFIPEWSALVFDKNNVFGEYSLFEKGNPVPVPDLLSIAKVGTYIIVKNSGVCADSIEWKNECIVTGVNGEFSQIVNIFPNPSSGIVTINHPLIQKINLYDTKGSELISSIPDADYQTTLDVSHLSNGLYHIILYTQTNQMIFTRIMISK
jgi:hypothetical protein